MVDYYGERAATEATELARRMHARGDFHGYWVWIRIVSVISELQSQADNSASAIEGAARREVSRMTPTSDQRVDSITISAESVNFAREASVDRILLPM